MILYDFPKLAERTVIQNVNFLAPIVFTPDSKEILAGIKDVCRNQVGINDVDRIGKDEIAVFDVATGAYKSVIRQMRSGSMDMTRDGALMSFDGDLSFYDYVVKQNRVDMHPLLSGRVMKASRFSSASLSRDGKRLLAAEVFTFNRAADRKSAVLLEDADKNEVTTVFEATGMSFVCSACSPNGKHFAVGTDMTIGIHGVRNDPLAGHVLLFEFKNP